MPDGTPWPRISIVTPSYNQGQYVEACVRSILLQGYNNLELIVMDGGSADDSMSVLQRYREYIYVLESKKDNGQSDAINQGFVKSTGQVLGWLNSDDMLLPGVLNKISFLCGGTVERTLVTGGQIELTEASQSISIDRVAGYGLRPSIEALLVRAPLLHQSSTFWTRDLWYASGAYLDEGLHHAMDADLWFRLIPKAKRIKLIDEPLSVWRRHDEQKTVTYDKYNIELRRLKEKYGYLGGRSLRGRLERMFWSHLGPYLYHLNTHPSIGLVPGGKIKYFENILLARNTAK